MATCSPSLEISSDEVFTDDEIDCWKLPRAMRVAKEKCINLGKTAKLEEIRCHIKLHLLADRQLRSDAIKCLTTSASDDCDRRNELVMLYKEAMKKVRLVDKEMNAVIPDFRKELESQMTKIDGAVLRSPILVLGETGAGKSSFINLLLGKDVLPCLLLSNTRVICEIEYGQKYSFKFFPCNKEDMFVEKTIDDFQSEKEFFEELAKYVQNEHFLKAQIRLPLDILKTGMIIVDSPGIGDTEEMTEITLNYLVEACAFIYIINSSAAGGVQEDRLLKLLQVVSEKALEDHGVFRPECAMFICNKWDQVPTTPVNEREPVWQMTKTKIMKHWQCEETQLFRLSTKEAAFMQKEGYVCGRFNKILSEINKLIPLSRQILIETSFRQLLNFVNKTIIYCSRYLIHEALPKDKRDIRVEARQKLDDVKTEIEKFFHSKIKHIELRHKTVVEKLQTFLSEESNIKSLSISLDEEIPENHNWQNTTLAVRAKIYERFEKLLTTWENENGHFRCIGQDVLQEFTSQLPKFDAKIHEVEQTFLEELNHLSDQIRSLACSEMEMEGETFKPKDICPMLGYLDIDLDSEEESEITLIPSSIKNRISKLNLGLKIFLGVTLSPVLLIGMAVMVPLYWKRELERKLERTWLESKFSGTKDDAKKKKIVGKYVDNIIRKLVEPVFLKTVIRQSLGPVLSYIEEQQFKLVKLIDRDLKLLQSLKDDDTSIEENKLVYEPVRCGMESLHRYLLFYQVKFLHRQPIEKPISLFEIWNEVVCQGVLATVFQARCNGDRKQKVAMRKSLIPLEVGNVKKYLEEESAYSLVNKPFLVRSLGIVKEMNALTKELVLYNVLAPLKCSLRQLILEKKATNQPCQDIATIVRDVVNGLQFLHDRNLVHHDLSLDTIAVDEKNNLKLTNIMCIRTMPRDYFSVKCTGSSQIQLCAHLPPDILSNPENCLYQPKHDMYSVGIMMFELVNSKRAYQEEISLLKFHTLTDFVEHAKKNLPQTETDIVYHRTMAVPPAHWDKMMEDCLHFLVQSKNWSNHWKNISSQ